MHNSGKNAVIHVQNDASLSLFGVASKPNVNEKFHGVLFELLMPSLQIAESPDNDCGDPRNSAFLCFSKTSTKSRRSIYHHDNMGKTIRCIPLTLASPSRRFPRIHWTRYNCCQQWPSGSHNMIVCGRVDIHSISHTSNQFSKRKSVRVLRKTVLLSTRAWVSF